MVRDRAAAVGRDPCAPCWLSFFNRERQRLVMTAAGREYLAVVRDALDRIAAGTERLVQRQGSGVLT